jgi:sulfate transport system permease protein
MHPNRRQIKRPLPGFGLSLGFTVTYLSLIVLLPLAALVVESLRMGWHDFWQVVSSPQVVAAYRLTIGASALSAAFCVIAGLLVAYVLARYAFPGKRLVDAMIDLPFALPTAVAGITLTALLSQNGWLGRPLEAMGLKVAFTPLGITVALVFIGLPFVVRTVQPVLEELEPDREEAAACLGASRWQTIRHVILPELFPAVLTGFALAFARGVGEYGSIIFIAGNLPYVSEIAPLLIVIKLSEYDYGGACAIATIMLGISFLTLLAINLIQAWSRRRFGYV